MAANYASNGVEMRVILRNFPMLIPSRWWERMNDDARQG